MYVAHPGRVTAHGRKVRAALKDALGGLVESRQQSTADLTRLTVTIAVRQTQASYGALLDPADLLADPGPDVEDGRGLSKVFTGAALAAGVGLVLCLYAGIDGASLLFVPLAVFAIAAVIVASFTGRLGQLGRVFSTFNRHINNAPYAVSSRCRRGGAPRLRSRGRPGRRAVGRRPRAGGALTLPTSTVGRLRLIRP
jgi:hypothetical protein